MVRHFDGPLLRCFGGLMVSDLATWRPGPVLLRSYAACPAMCRTAGRGTVPRSDPLHQLCRNCTVPGSAGVRESGVPTYTVGRGSVRAYCPAVLALLMST